MLKPISIEQAQKSVRDVVEESFGPFEPGTMLDNLVSVMQEALAAHQAQMEEFLQQTFIKKNEDLKRDRVGNIVEEIDLVSDGQAWTVQMPPPKDGYVFRIPIEGWSIDTNISISGGCKHEWKTYQGFSESYDYCVHCDKKA